MALSFPQADSEIAAHIDAQHVSDAAKTPHLLSTLPQAKIGWARTIRESGSAINRIFGLCLLADDTLALVAVGPRGGHKIEWKFGRV